MAGIIKKISGPLIVASDMQDCNLYDLVKVGNLKLIGEVIELRGDKASIQVYEETTGLTCGEIVEDTYSPLSMELGPGLIGNVFDGIGRPLKDLRQMYGDRIERGVMYSTLNAEKLWNFVATKSVGDKVCGGDILGYVKETSLIKHYIMVPVEIEGEIELISSGDFNINQIVAIIKTKKEKRDITMKSAWPVRIGRPYKNKIAIDEPLITGQRVIDTMFPIAKGGVACIPGPFGSGKTVVQHQLAKWSDAEIVVYIGCGERGNEITDVLNEFPKIRDPKTNKLLIERTVIIANTSDMPVAAREASIYTGITIAEYYRDMGYNVVIMADSTSRWAEALREMSGRLEEMPGEEGYPNYLGSRLAEFYERAGKVKVKGSLDKLGSITAIGAVSPQGGDLSEPVSQATLRIVKCFWGLSSSLAYKRHYPAIDWLISYSGYNTKLSRWYEKNLAIDFNKLKDFANVVLQKESELNEIVQLVGYDVLSDKEKFLLDISQSIREDFLHQNAFDKVDTYTSLNKQRLMLKTIFDYNEFGLKALTKGISYDSILNLDLKKELSQMKYIDEKELDKFKELHDLISNKIVQLIDLEAK